MFTPTLSNVKRAFRAFKNPLASKKTIRHNVVSYLKACIVLGDKNIFHKHVQRKVR